MRKVIRTTYSYWPLALWYGLVTHLLVIVSSTPISLQERHYYGFVTLALSTLGFLHSKAAGHLATGLMLATGAFAKFSFSPVIREFSISIGSIGIHFETGFFLLLVFYLVVNAVKIPGWWNQLTYDPKPQ